MRSWIHPYWIIAAVVIGIPTCWFYVEVVKPIVCLFNTKCGSVSW
jgi:hypothetical protein